MTNTLLKTSIDQIKTNITINEKHITAIAGVTLFAILLLIPDPAYADFESTLCRILNTLNGNVARTVAAVGIIFLGFSLFLGKISWGIAIALGVGIAAVFGAKDLVALLEDGSTSATFCA